jgi:hypothetical protein
MRAYSAALEARGARASVLAGNAPPLRYRRGGVWEPWPEGLRVLLVGESYVVASGFHAERLT